ncbi:hypothetical protein SAMD00019534_118710, partial [Acytostelium subglobosum LB1]|uniref:hypothetical protein n=1 Tax=Acytostelium subglobosum LB1 TaxID=1410327 RepID=UPI000644F92F
KYIYLIDREINITMVFEGIVSDVLSKVLGEYVKNLNKDQLKIGVLGGNVVLTNLELKEDALNNLPINMPITVKKGYLGRLELKVPWKDLKSKPVIVNIDSIYALAVPQTQNYKYDEEAEKKKEKELKRKRIENYEWMKSIKEAENEQTGGKATDSSFTDRLVTKIIDNLQIKINKIHIRFENRNELGRLYAVGVTLDNISAQSCDERWIPSIIDSTKTNMIRKLAEMNSLGMYIDADATSMLGLSDHEFHDAFYNAIPTTRTHESMTKKFMLKPISSQLKVSINKSDAIDKAIPKIITECIFSDIICALSSAQYHSIMNILQFTNEFLRDIKFLKYRPQVGVRENPRAWWKYAGQVTLENIHQRRYQRSWAYIFERRKDRIKYVELFKRSLPNIHWLTPLTKPETASLAEMEERLSFEDVIFYRSLAYAEIKKETEKNKIRKDFLQSKKADRTFFQNLFNKKKEEDEKEAPIVTLSHNERDELYRTIEYSEVIESVEEPPDWVKIVANLTIKSISMQLVENDTPFIDTVFSALTVKLEQRKEGIRVLSGIKQFEVYDQFTKGTEYKKIISPALTGGTQQTFCSAIVDTCPPNKAIDLLLDLNMEPLQVIAPKPLIMKIVEFFTNQDAIDLTNITNMAGDYIDNFTEKTKMQLQEALDTHKTVALHVKIQAPVIIIPENVTIKNSNALVLDLGSFKFESDAANQKIKGKLVSSTSEDDFYDRFNLSLESVQMLLTNDIHSWNDKRVQSEQRTHIINQFDVHLSIFSCIQQDSLTLTKVKIKASPALESSSEQFTGDSAPSPSTAPTTRKVTIIKKVLKKKPPTENITISVVAKIKSLGLVLNQETNRRIGIFSINDIMVETVLYKDTRMTLRGTLGSIKLEDLTDNPASLYKHVITPQDQEGSMLTFSFNTHPTTLTNYPGYDSSVQANIKSIIVNAQVGYVYQLQTYLLGGMLDPILNKPVVPVPVATSSSNQAGNEYFDSIDPLSTSLSVDTLTPVSRTKLDIVMETPIFRVPQALNSTNMIQLELGKIIVSNRFDNFRDTAQPLDIMNIRLESSNMTIHDNDNVSNFLNKMDLDLALTRFLIPNHQIDVDDLVIDMNLSNISFHLTQKQYVFFLKMMDNAMRAIGNVLQTVSLPPPPSSDIPYYGEHEVLKNMGKVTLSMNITVPNLSFKISTTETDIAMFEMRQMVIQFKTSERQKMKLDFSMDSIVLTDARSDSPNIFKNLMENHQSRKATETVSFITVGYLRDSYLGDQYINLEINNPCLFVSPTPIFLIVDFFLKPLQTLEQSAPVVPEPTTSSPKFLAQTRKLNPELLRTPTITLSCNLNVEVTMVENEAQANTRCLVAKTKSHVYFKRDPKGMENAIVSLRDTKIKIFRPSVAVDSTVDGSRQGSRPIQILRSLDHIKVQYIKENETADYFKTKISVTSSIIKTYFSYDDINTILKIVQNLSIATQSSIAQAANNNNTDLSSSTASFDLSSSISSVDAGQLVPASGSSSPDLFIQNEFLTFECPSMSVLLINESMDIYLPIAELYLSGLQAKITNWSTEMELKTSVTFKADYFNESLMKFEPFIEDWGFNFDIKKTGKRTRATFMATRQILNMNVTHALLQTLASTVHLIKLKDKENKTSLKSRIVSSNSTLSKYLSKKVTSPEDLQESLLSASTSSLGAPIKPKFHSHWLMNLTGCPIDYSLPVLEAMQELQDDNESSYSDSLSMSSATMSTTSQLSTQSSRINVANNVLQPVQIKATKGRDSSIGAKTSIDLFIHGCRLESVSLDAIGSRVYRLKQPQQQGLSASTTTIVPLQGDIDIDVEARLQRDGSKIVYIRSMVQFVNNSSIPMHLSFKEDNHVDSAVLVQQNEKYSVPVDAFFGFSRFWIKMANSPHWSEAISPAALVSEFEKEQAKLDKKQDGAVRRENSRPLKLVDRLERISFVAVSVTNQTHLLGNSTVPELSKNKFQVISISAQVQIENLLPIPFKIRFAKDEEPVLIASGEKLDVFSYAPGTNLSVSLSDIEKFPETTQTLINGDNVAKQFKLLTSQMTGKELTLQVEKFEEVKGIRVLSFYCQYWLVNNSMLPLVVKGDGEEIALPPNTSTAMNPPILYHSNNIKLRVIDGNTNNNQVKYCNSVPIVTVGHTGSLSIPGSSHAYEVSYSIEFCQHSKFGLSKVVTFTPRYVIQNKLDFPIMVSQYVKTEKKIERIDLMTLQPNAHSPLHWTVPTEDKSISIKSASGTQEWSGSFNIDTVCETIVRIRDSEPAKPSVHCNVTIMEEKGTLYVLIPEASQEHPPFLIQNDTPYNISYHQKNALPANQQRFDHLTPTLTMPFAWDEPSMPSILVAYLDGEPMKRDLKLNKITGYEVKVNSITIYVTITVERTSRLVKFSTHSSKYNLIKHWKENVNTKVDREATEFQFFVRMSGIGLSVIDQSPKELCYVSLSDFFLQTEHSMYETSLEVKIGDLQLDNQLVRTEFPVMLFTTMKGDNRKDFLHLSVIKSNFDNIDHFRYFSILIQELMLDFEDNWLKEVLDFVNSMPDFHNHSASHHHQQQQSQQQQQQSLTDSDMNDTAQELYPVFSIEPPTLDSTAHRMVYFALLVLNPIKVNITLSLQKDGLFKTDHKALSSIEGLGLSLTKLDRAPITLQGLLMEHPFSSWNTMIDKLKSTYIKQVIGQFYNILGSIDIIGNPIGLFRNFGTGVQDFFVEPAQGLVKSPADFGKGLAKGTSSLIKNSVFGTFNTISKITGTIGSGVATLSFDDKYLQDRKAQQSKKPKHVGEGLAMGGIGIGKGLFQGITGIVTKPVEGAKKDGFLGFAKGLAQGVIGVAVKPTAAVIDATTKATEGIKNTTNLQEFKDRKRPPRCFGADNVLRQYEALESEGWYLLKTTHKYKHSGDNYIWHYPINHECLVILSDKRLIYQKIKRSIVASNFMFQIPYEVIKEVLYVPGNGLVLKLSPPQDLSLLERSVSSKVIPADDDNMNMIFNMKIDHALRLFNEK